MKKLSIILFSLAVLSFSPVLATADMVEGSVQGFTCITVGKTCPIGQEDPLAAVESVFGVYTMDGKFYFVPNVSRSVLARHINRPVRVSGRLNKQYSSIDADKIEAKQKGAWTTTWTLEAQERMFNDIYRNRPMTK
jgi:hypothetical protein